jgi:hypothetical protein
VALLLITMITVSRSDAQAAVVMGVGFLTFGLIMMLRPSNVRANLQRFADSWKEGSWHPYKMPVWGLRLAGLLVLAGAMLLFYVAYLGFAG